MKTTIQGEKPKTRLKNFEIYIFLNIYITHYQNDDTRRVGTPLIPQRSLLHTPTERPQAERASAQQAAAQIVRDQINSIYDTDTQAQTAS